MKIAMIGAGSLVFGRTLLNDMLSVATIRAIDNMLSAPDGTISFWIPVNVRGVEKGDKKRANSSFASSFRGRSSPGENCSYSPGNSAGSSCRESA